MSDQNSATNKGLGFIGEDLFIEGTVHAQKKMVVSGTVNGSVSGDQEIVVTESGNVIGRIEANIILVAGKVAGDLLAHKRLEVNATATIQGEVQVPSGQLLIKEGAQLEARCTTLNEKPQGVISSS
ncbi:MAG: polymer-forming cytoskeletal protein [SAR324 cluster bacterium]|jgi:cytoskeletal protein CcmA (bactofilin family)|nr:polymer-forming cytoskeletal protein [SAR324 cluster bacterium]